MDFLEYATKHREEYIRMICDLTSIPAPSHKEEKRTAAVCGLLHEMGYTDAFSDENGNVILEIKGCHPELPVHIYMAHIDTVFPDETPIDVQIQDGRICAPGVGDDTTNVCALLMLMQYLSENPVTPNQDSVIVFDVGEEGLGNLKGSRAVIERYKGRIGQMMGIDLGYDAAIDHAVGSRRFDIEIRSEGGHSYSNFGAPNAIAIASEMIHDLYAIDAMSMPGKTTYNVGIIEGGTSVNTIAQQVHFLYEYRSDQADGLACMEQSMKAVLDRYQSSPCEIKVQKIGDRPSMGDVDPDLMAELRQQVDAGIFRYTGIHPVFVSGSTDCNMPLSLGIPAICFGAYIGEGAHTREEYVEVESLVPGLAACMDIIITDMMK